MTIDKTIISALSEFGYPCYRDVYTGEDEIYFVFTYNVMPDAYSDDCPEYHDYMCQVHLWCPSTFNTISIAKRIKLSLENAGFTYPEQVDASDEDNQHLVFEFDAIEHIERE